MRIGVDSGGTFTDVVSLGPEGLRVHKLRSTPDDPSHAILEGVAALSAPHDRPDVVHGSTVATNAVLERKGARVALVATKGFEDVLRIGRQTRPELYNIFVPPPRPLVDPALTFGIGERLDADGHVLTAIDAGDLARLADRFAALDVDIVAVCLLHAYANPVHERAVAAHLRARGLRVCASHEVLPEYREFERWSTTVVNAYVTPLIDRYLETLEAKLLNDNTPYGNTPFGAADLQVGGTSRGPEGPRLRTEGRLSIMQSNGGSISASAARAQAVRTILSGPAAGVVGARVVARAAGCRRVISFDMGGTSTDVSLIDDAIPTTTDSRVGDFPVRLPVIDIHTVGAGGGSIAAVDSGGALRVGPRSAGANPGPVCYGTGTELTVTDANLLLGRLDPACFLGGQMAIDVARTHAVASEMARRLKMRVLDLAEGIVRVANANMERAIRVVSVERGHDPREFALLAFGGAGGMHACEIAERLEMPSVIVPRHAGVLSALGMLASDVSKNYAAQVLRRTDDVSVADLATRLAPLVRQATGDLAAEGFRGSRQRLAQSLDVRYVGQSYELNVPFGPGYRRAFDRLHDRLYGYANPTRPTEVVAVRVAADGVTAKPTLPFTRPRRAFTPKPASVRSGRFGGRAVKVAFYRWDALVPGARATGAAVITGGEATIVVPPRWKFHVDGYGNVIAVAPNGAAGLQARARRADLKVGPSIGRA